VADPVTTRNLDVLSFGEALVDFFPERPGIPLAECEVFHRHLGGAPANVAVGLSRLGVRVGLMTLVGPDDFGRFVRGRLAHEGVDASAVGTHRTAKTGVTFVSVATDGARSFLFFRHPSAAQLIAEVDVDPAQVARARVFHFGSSTLCREPSRAATRKALDAAVAAGALISIDPNWRPHLWEDPSEAAPILRSVIARADVVKISDDELNPLAGTADPAAGARALRSLGAKLVVVTLGGRGCYFDAPAGTGFLPGERVEVVDTTGAGDGFVAGLLSRLLPALSPSSTIADLDREAITRACAFGNRVGARAVTKLGATAGLPLLTEI
jgi:fructokinase